MARLVAKSQKALKKGSNPSPEQNKSQPYFFESIEPLESENDGCGKKYHVHHILLGRYIRVPPFSLSHFFATFCYTVCRLMQLTSNTHSIYTITVHIVGKVIEYAFRWYMICQKKFEFYVRYCISNVELCIGTATGFRNILFTFKQFCFYVNYNVVYV